MQITMTPDLVLPDHPHVRAYLRVEQLRLRPDFEVTQTMRSNARRFHNKVVALDGADEEPTGFHLLGSGLYRSVYRRGNYVYKFATDGYVECNETEHVFFTELRKLGYGWLIPPTAMIGSTLVMPYYKLQQFSRNIQWSYSDKLDTSWPFNAMLAWGLRMWFDESLCYWDAHFENLCLDDQYQPVLIDGGMGVDTLQGFLEAHVD